MSERKLSDELAERGSDSLAKLFEGAFGVAEFMADSEVDVPGALGLTPDEWMQRRLAGPVRLSQEERRQLVDGHPDKTTRELAEVAGVDHGTIARDRRAAVADATDALESATLEESSEGHAVADATPPLQAVDEPTPKELAAKESKAQREASREAPMLDDAFELRFGDARQVLEDVPESSVPLVLTDPPYGDEAEPLYQWLAEWSAKVLIPGGSLIVYTGQSRLDRDMRIFGEQLRYWWLLSMLHTQSQSLPGKFVRAEFKPVLWFVKQHRRGRGLVNDVLRPPKRDKSEHKWGQAEGGVSFLIEHLTAPGERIVDPFAGTATWGRISTEMGRRWLGAEVEQDMEKRALGVIAA